VWARRVCVGFARAKACGFAAGRELAQSASSRGAPRSELAETARV